MAGVSGPGLRRASSVRSSERHATAERKYRLEELLRRCGLAEHGHGAEAAKIIGVDKSTLFGWRDVRAQNRGPTDEAIEKLERYAVWLDGCSEFSRTA
jgi:hypothetical protein